MKLFRSIVIAFFQAALAASVLATEHALLIGVTKYPNLEEKHWLRGPAHDVEIVDGLLQKRFKVDPKYIHKLVGWPDKAEDRPTKANIRKAFADLAKQVKPGDAVMILFSGHGSQQPANPNPSNIEPDGLDELFLPADTAKWDEAKKTIEGAIIDDEVGQWVTEIREKGAFVWIIFDSCHSGTMTRGISHEGRVNREIAPAALQVPALAITAPVTRGTQVLKANTGGEFSASAAKNKPGMGGVVAMYAAQSVEPTFELPIPTEKSDFHGIFSYTLVQILTEIKKPLTYRDLVATVSIAYRGSGILQPTPLIEGTDMDREVMGTKNVANRPPITFTGLFIPPGLFEVDAGHLMGLREGSVIEVYPPAIAPDSDKPLGVAVVEQTKAAVALVTPKDWNGMAAAPLAKLSGGCRAKIIYEKMALPDLNVALQTGSGDKVKTVAIEALSKEQRAVLDKIRTNSSPWKWSDKLEGADWILRFADNKMVLLPSSGWSEAYGRRDAKVSPPEFSLTKDTEVKSALERITRARQLIHIAGNTSSSAAVEMDVKLIRFEKHGDAKGKAVEHGAQGRVLHSGEEIAFEIRNSGLTAIDVSLLFVDSRFGITAVFPERGTIDDNRIPPGGTIVTPRLEVTIDTAGPEQVVALGVRSTGNRVDFTCLEQASLERTRGTLALDTPLGELLKGAMYHEGETRGLSRSRSSDHTAKLITWWTLPK